MKKQTIVLSAVACSILGMALEASAAPKWAKKGETIVKCQGIAKKGANDCGANGHDCSGKAVQDSDPNEWVYVPEGVCEKIAGGVVYKAKKVE